MGYIRLTKTDGTIMWLQVHMIQIVSQEPNGPVVVEYGGYGALDRERLEVKEFLDNVMEAIRRATEGDGWVDAHTMTFSDD